MELFPFEGFVYGCSITICVTGLLFSSITIYVTGLLCCFSFGLSKVQPCWVAVYWWRSQRGCHHTKQTQAICHKEKLCYIHKQSKITKSVPVTFTSKARSQKVSQTFLNQSISWKIMRLQHVFSPSAMPMPITADTADRLIHNHSGHDSVTLRIVFPSPPSPVIPVPAGTSLETCRR